jgi:GT2 family glycosyltransferase
VIVFGLAVSSQKAYTEFAKAGMDSVGGPDAVIIVRENAKSIAAAYNEILESVCNDHPDAEAVVLLHQDVQLTDPLFRDKVAARLVDPTIGLIGLFGARGVRSIVYWRADKKGYVQEGDRTLDFGRGFHDVDAVDGMLMILSPPVYRTFRFDQWVARAFHGYDIDFSYQVRDAGFRVVVDDIRAVHHTKGGLGDRAAYVAASRAWRKKWLRDATPGKRLASWLDEVFATVSRDDISVAKLLRRACARVDDERRSGT